MRYGVLALALLLVALSGCFAGTKHVGPQPGPARGPVITSAGFSHTDLYARSSDMFSVEWISGAPPFTISINMGGGTTNDVPAGTAATSPFEQWFILIAGDWNFAVTVTDAHGLSTSAVGEYRVYAVSDPHPPYITNTSYEEPALTVDVYDTNFNDVTVVVTEPEGLKVDEASKLLAGGSGSVVFYWSAVDYIAGATGETVITSDNGHSLDTATATITISPIYTPDGALAAVPAVRQATTDDVVTVAVISGDFSNPFQYANSVGVTVNVGATYVDGTLNVGVPGYEQMNVDGVWTSVAPDGFILPNDFMIQENDIGSGNVRIDFNVTPVGGSETTDGGALFNFGLQFDHAGTYTLGFEEFHDVKRTYYSDGASNEYFWDDISNSYPGMPNSIEVREP